VIRALWWENLRLREHLEDVGIDGKIVKLIFIKSDGWSTNWIDLAQDKDRWRSLENAVINFQVAKIARNFLPR
jgi:hypothetical protein